MPEASSARGAPKAPALTAAVSASRSVHRAFDVLPQPPRQRRTVVFATIPKPCAAPVHPMSRSLPDPGATMRSSPGPPAGFAPQRPAPSFGTQRSFRWSVSFAGVPLASVTMSSVTRFEGRRRPL
jgi:hypothetical protein